MFSKNMVIALVVGVIIVYSGNYAIYATAFPENPTTHDYFNKICDMPYIETYGIQTANFWTVGGDCNDRSFVFADYLKSKGEKNVQVCYVLQLDNEGHIIGNGHAFVLWNNKAYNFAHDPKGRYYDADLSEFKVYLKQHNMNTLYVLNGTIWNPNNKTSF